MKKKFTVVSSEDLSEFEAIVNDLLAEGYVLHGPVSVTAWHEPEGGAIVFHQAMINNPYGLVAKTS